MGSKRAVMRDTFDESFNALIEDGYVEEAGTGPDGERVCRLADKAIEQDHYQAELREAIANNSPAEILKRIAKSN